MKNLSPFCTCTNFACPLHPSKHEKGCAPCIQKNLKTREMPNCFFDLIPGTENRKNDTFGEFADYVIKNDQQNGKLSG